MQEVRQDAHHISTTLERVLPTVVDGREAILEMKREGYRGWRDLEWIGFWFEHLVETKVLPVTGGRRGPTFGRTEFDLRLRRVWDLKVHPTSAPSLILNDVEAVDHCIEACGGLGFIVVNGMAEYDESGDFKRWHDALKGGRSDYERARINRGAPSRRRKVRFTPTEIVVAFIPNLKALDSHLQSGRLGYFQKGMRNSNGTPRRPKYLVRAGYFPSLSVVERTDLRWRLDTRE